MNKQYITDNFGNRILPITHQSAVLDDNGNPLNNILGTFAKRFVGTTSERENLSLGAADAGIMYFDTTLGTPLWWNGTNWIGAQSGNSNITYDVVNAVNQ